MSSPRYITRGPWECTGSDGKRYQVLEEVAIMKTPGFEDGDSSSQSQYNTTDGRFLEWIEKGRYQIENTDIILQSNDPSAT
jgi:hypothetical protein